MAETIDNLSIDTYKQFDLSQQILKEGVIETGAVLPPRTAIDVTAPVYYSDELQMLLDLGKERSLWAHFSPPKDYYIQRSNTFGLHLIPSLPSEKKEVQLQRIEKTTEIDRPAELPWGRDQEDRMEREEKAILTDFLNTISRLDIDLREIYTRRLQYHKG